MSLETFEIYPFLQKLTTFCSLSYHLVAMCIFSEALNVFKMSALIEGHRIRSDRRHVRSSVVLFVYNCVSQAPNEGAKHCSQPSTLLRRSALSNQFKTFQSRPYLLI